MWSVIWTTLYNIFPLTGFRTSENWSNGFGNVSIVWGTDFDLLELSKSVDIPLNVNFLDWLLMFL
jgi:hypothetical protein